MHLSDPAEGSGYTYTHDLGIQAMQQNLGLSDEQIDRKINVDDSDKEATEKAIQECVDDGCNIIFTTSWGYMDATEEMVEKYPDIYFAHGTGYKSNGKNIVKEVLGEINSSMQSIKQIKASTRRLEDSRNGVSENSGTLFMS